MRKVLLICALATLLLVLFAGSALAFHYPDEQGTTCFRCHSTHQGVGEVLMTSIVPATFGRGIVDVQDRYGYISVSTVCVACHDGTGARSVTGGSNMMHSGLFDLDAMINGQDVANFSAHSVDLAEDLITPVAVAPGNKGGETHKPEFSCASCHQPHGTFSSDSGNRAHAYMRLNPNQTIDGKFYPEGGDNPSWDDRMDAILEAGDQVTLVELTRTGTEGNYLYKAEADEAPWLRAYFQRLRRYALYPVAIQQNDGWLFQRVIDGNSWSTNFEVNAIDGEIRIAEDLGETINAAVFLPIIVQVTGDFEGTYYDEDGAEVTRDVRMYTSNVNRWCGSCHGYYDISNRTEDTYEIDGQEYHGHNVYRRWSNSYATPYSEDGNSNCLSCHFAHGTRGDLMMDSNKQIVGDNFSDRTPANKRHIGGSVCIACHYSSHGNEFVWDSDFRPYDQRFY
ncbi:hypothetical protein [Dethiobacter alkaliphilus]|uniref:Doubled CXXCH motif domain-containing protein n=1 Tax=Dethiobacter alkaliphilus AHT 1 TaxID=555088 RepID=C0GG42_DETAL|nr:hypothetical protein [Dethiobacter alkaliphilus]EEG77731.1 hypothetical protein DealDRAFT_1451 [Dethiobacter alkaliphilus AHT 1]